MRRTLTCGDEAKGLLSIMERSDTAMRTPVQRVAAVIKAKLGSFAHTKMAIKRRTPHGRGAKSRSTCSTNCYSANVGEGNKMRTTYGASAHIVSR